MASAHYFLHFSVKNFWVCVVLLIVDSGLAETKQCIGRAVIYLSWRLTRFGYSAFFGAGFELEYGDRKGADSFSVKESNEGKNAE